MGAEQTHKGYYRDPAVHGDTIVFTSEGDLWTVSVHGGAAQRLTTAPGTESGLIDVRHNHGGNIDSWLLGKLLRQAWFYFQPRVGNPSWNMQYAFRGHIVVLCDHETASDGEAFAEGFRRLKLGKVIGTRTWGGEIWLSGSNVQADNGVATAAETGVYADGKWLIEGRGVEPDVEVDNMPHETFSGSDPQLAAALKELQEEIKADPRAVPAAPQHPDKSFKYQQ